MDSLQGLTALDRLSLCSIFTTQGREDTARHATIAQQCEGYYKDNGAYSTRLSGDEEVY